MSSDALPVAFVDAIVRELPGNVALFGDAVPERHHHDWSGLAPVRPLALFRPRSTEETSTILRLCHVHRVPIVPQGGLTGLAGGAQPVANGVVISLERMCQIEEVDVVMATMTVGAGAPLAACQAAAEEAGLLLAIDLGARGSCAIGGNLSTNAGGNRVIRYGMARDHVLGLEVVLPDGTIVSSLNKLIKNNAGYDLKQLFIGSEGTLGVITRVILKLHARPRIFASALCAAADFDSILETLKQARSQLGPAVTSFEVMWPSFYDFMSSHVRGAKRAFADRHGAYALIEIGGFDGARDVERFQECLSGLLERGVLNDVIVAQSERETLEIWAAREGVSEYSQILGPLTAFDIGLNLTKSGVFVEQIEAELKRRWPDAIPLSYGHIGDSNLHLVVHVPSAGAHQPHDEICDLVYGAVRAAGGTISAEHGIGLMKKPYLGFTRSPSELETMARIKRALDPHAILNLGKVI
ncbi:FAD-binding oxidoreductase [Terrarubrum flagellatum]|uniref:FAD-binding oxidoreductase n=1 Tax=Terrirubrum flagellatum TaxID=2895980 RepID=UPI003144E5F6